MKSKLKEKKIIKVNFTRITHKILIIKNSAKSKSKSQK